MSPTTPKTAAPGTTGARPREPFFRATSEHLIITRRGLALIQTLLTVTGLILAIIGIRSAYQQVGTDTSAGHVITIAIIVAFLAIGIVAAANFRNLPTSRHNRNRA